MSGRCPASPDGWAIEVARTRRERGRGLLGRDGLEDREGLWLPVRSVHTIGMRFPLDLVWLDRDGDVIRVDAGVGRGRIRTCLRARSGVVEIAAGSGEGLVAALAAGTTTQARLSRYRPAPGEPGG